MSIITHVPFRFLVDREKCFTDQETESQGDRVTCLRPQTIMASEQDTDLGWTPASEQTLSTCLQPAFLQSKPEDGIAP